MALSTPACSEDLGVVLIVLTSGYGISYCGGRPTRHPRRWLHLGGPEEGVGARLGFFPETTRMGSISGAVESLVRGIGIIVES